MSGGLTPAGFVAPTVEEEVLDLNTKYLANVSPTLDLAPDQPIGQFIGIQAEKFAELWEVVATIYNAINPDAAEDQLLDNVSAITGSRRRSAKYSHVAATLNLNAGTTVSVGAIVSVATQPANRWVLEADVVNSSGSAGNFSASFRSEQPGPFAANASTLTVIETPTIGWNSVTNAADAVAGIPEDSDAVLRVRREDELAAAGACTVDAMRADLLEVAGVLQAFVFDNDTLITDNNGVPAKAFHVVIWDGEVPGATNDSIAQTIWDNKPSGIQAYGSGSTLGQAIDSQGKPHTVLFDRAIQVPIWIELSTGGTDVNARTAIRAKMKAYADSILTVGTDVIALAFRAQALGVANGLGVITDVPTYFQGTAPNPTGTGNIVISNLQIATLDTTHIKIDGFS